MYQTEIYIDHRYRDGWWGVRNGDVEVKIGDVFTTQIKEKHATYKEICDNPYRERQIISETPIKLTIKTIHAYGKSLDHMGEGMTAAIQFEEDTEPLIQECIRK